MTNPTTPPHVPQYQSPPTVANRKWLIFGIFIGAIIFMCCGCGVFGFLFWGFTARSPAAPLPVITAAIPVPPSPSAVGPTFTPASLPANFPTTFPVHPSLTPSLVIPDAKDPRGALISLESTSTETHNSLAQWYDRQTPNFGWKETLSTFNPDQIVRAYTKDGLTVQLAISPGLNGNPPTVVIIYHAN